MRSVVHTHLIIVIAGGMLMIFTGCATQQDLLNVERRLATVESNTRMMSENLESIDTGVEKRANTLRELYAGQGAEFYQLKEDIRGLNGRVEENSHNIDQRLKSIEDSLNLMRTSVNEMSAKVSANENRIKRMEDFMGLEPIKESASAAAAPEAANAPANPQPVPPAKNMPPEALYNAAKQAYDRGDMETARQGFESFLEKYPDSEIADNALFWIGEIYFSEGWYQKAILEYQNVIDKYPKGNKVPGAYLKQGISFQQLGEEANARLILKELIRKFPDSNEAKIARAKIERSE